eukprot:jgi/Chrzof1/9895/Cz04g19290.t1
MSSTPTTSSMGWFLIMMAACSLLLGAVPTEGRLLSAVAYAAAATQQATGYATAQAQAAAVQGRSAVAQAVAQGDTAVAQAAAQAASRAATYYPPGSATSYAQGTVYVQRGGQAPVAMQSGYPPSAVQTGYQPSAAQTGYQPSAGTPSESPQAPPAPGDAVSDSVLKAVLDQHNSYRAKHQVAPLAWSNSLAARAQNWANGCVFQHSGSGENLAMGHASFQQAVNDWYAEVSQYSYQAGQYSSATGHFTQMVWKGSSQLGCGYAPSCAMYVCHYDPPGNVIGNFNDNVFPPTSK